MEEKYPSKREIDKLLKNGFENNRGMWVKHSYEVGKLCKFIATDIGLDGNFAYACGCLHDIGRTCGFSYMRHIIDGYMILKDKYPDVARICLTHSFPIKDIKSYPGEVDISKRQYDFLDRFLNGYTYDDYDLLVQLVDSIVTGKGACLQEKRIVDVILRYGVNDFTVEKIRRLFEIKSYFEKRLKKSIYYYTNDVINNTFEF